MSKQTTRKQVVCSQNNLEMLAPVEDEEEEK